MKVIIISILLFFSANAQVWYVDSAATGANNGTSWANAWNNLYNISWNSIQDGDTIYVSGGTTSRTYVPNTIYGIVLGNYDAATPFWTFDSTVVLCPSWETGHNGDVYIATGSNTHRAILRVGNISNLKITGFIFEDRRTRGATPVGMIMLGNGSWGDVDSLIQFVGNHVIGNGMAGFMYLSTAKAFIDSNIFEQTENDLAYEQDPFGISSGRGGHTITNNKIIMRNGFDIGGGTRDTVNLYTTVGSNFLTDTRLNMTPNYYYNAHASVGYPENDTTYNMYVDSNTTNTFYGDWDILTGDGARIETANYPTVQGLGWGTDANHRDGIQFSNFGLGQSLLKGYTGNASTSDTITYTDTSLTDIRLNTRLHLNIGSIITSGGSTLTVTDNTTNTFYGTWVGGTPTNGDGYYIDSSATILDQRLTMTIANNLLIDTREEGDSWNSMIYSSGPYCSQIFYIYNNVIVSRKNNTSISNIWVGHGNATPFNLYDQSVHVLNNTIITKGGGFTDGTTIMTGYNNDTMIVKNNLYVIDTTSALLLNLDGGDGFPSCYKKFNHNSYNYYGGTPHTSFAFDNAAAMTWDAWRTNPFYQDTNSTFSNSTYVSFAEKYGIDIADYYTITGRDSAEDLSSDYPFLATDILGNPRSGTWDIGSLEWQGETSTDTIPYFHFTDLNNAEINTQYEAYAVISLVDTIVTYAVSGTGTPEFKVGVLDTYDANNKTADSGDTLYVRNTSSGSYLTGVNTIITANGFSDTYTITTKINPITPSEAKIVRGSNGLILKDKNGSIIKSR